MTVDLERVPVTLSVRQLAACVAELNSDNQADFFVELARLFHGFTGTGAGGQASMIGEALAKVGGDRAMDLLSLVLEYAQSAAVKKVMEE